MGTPFPCRISFALIEPTKPGELTTHGTLLAANPVCQTVPPCQSVCSSVVDLKLTELSVTHTLDAEERRLTKQAALICWQSVLYFPLSQPLSYFTRHVNRPAFAKHCLKPLASDILGIFIKMQIPGSHHRFEGRKISL